MFAVLKQYNDETINQGVDTVLPLTHIVQDTPRPRCPSQDRYGQLIEPRGLFVTLGHNGEDGQTDGRCTVRHLTRSVRPLIIQAKAVEGMNAVKAWKVELSERFNNTTGLALTRAIIKAGYTAIITVDQEFNPGEIVLLNLSKTELSHLRK